MRCSVTLRLLLLGLLFISGSFPSPARAKTRGDEFVSRLADIDGVRLHYTTGGHGPALVLLHGFLETSRMWTSILPVLGAKFTVIVPDRPGIAKARIVGHDIGLMLAYAYAAQFPTEVEKLVMMDAFLPGVDGWKAIFDDPHDWHFRFNGPTPEQLVRGSERISFEYFWNDLAANKTRSIPEADRKAYTEAYAQPGRRRAA
jgi:pimeloyl-ACP methyl ester carboxylesterase